MCRQITKSQKILLKILYFAGTVFALIPFKTDKISKQIVERKSLKILAQILFSILVVSLSFQILNTFDKVSHNLSNTKLVVFGNVTNCLSIFAISSYSFVILKSRKIIEVLNETKFLCSFLFQNQSSVNLLPGFLIFQCFVLQPLFFTYDFLLLMYFLFLDFCSHIVLFIPIIGFYAAKLLIVYILLVLHLQSLLLKNLLDYPNVDDYFKVLTTISKVCELTKCLASFYIFCQYFFILSFVFGICSYILTAVLGNLTVFEASCATGIYLFFSIYEIFNLWVMIKICKSLRQNVSL